MFGRKKKPLVGLDIGSWSIKQTELEPLNGERSYRLVSVGAQSLAPAAIVDGAIMDAASVADSIKDLLSAQQVRTRDVAASLGGGAVIVKRIRLPEMSAEELAESIYWEAEQYVPFDIREVSLDYQVIEGSLAGGSMEVLLVAAKKDTIADYSSVIVRAGRIARIIDVDVFALQNCYEVNYGPDVDAIVALVAVGASRTSISIIRGSVSLFSRSTPIGGNSYTESLQRELNLTTQQAEDLKKSGPSNGTSSSGVLATLQTVSESLIAEVQRTFGFFVGSSSEERIDRILVTGGASRTPGLMDLMGQRLASDIEPLNPFRRVDCDPRSFAPAFLDQIAPSAAIAVGLAMRRMREKR